MAKKTTASRKISPAQADSFEAVARALECDPSEEAFDHALGKIGKAKPDPVGEKKRKGKGTA